MHNPNGPYPGRQLFLGLTISQNPFFAYLVTGRSPESRERKAILLEDGIRIGPAGNSPYDPLRHYAAVKYANSTGIAAVSNGIQTEAIFETYTLLFNTASLPGQDYLEKILEGAGAEPDSYHTPRIAGLITRSGDQASPVFILGLKAHNLPAKAVLFSPAPGTMLSLSTYKGALDSPEARDPSAALPELEFKGTTPAELAGYIFEISAALYQGHDIRVSSVAGIRSANLTWSLAVHNAR